MNIVDRVCEELNEVIHKDYRIVKDWLCIAPVGSVNYPGLFTDGSDIDTKLLTIPSLGQIAEGDKMLNCDVPLKSGEICEVKDYREFFRIFCKQNINFVEVLFSDYALPNVDYLNEWNLLVSRREEFARMNPLKTLKCCAGTYNNMRRKFDTFAEVGKYVGKDIQQAGRVVQFADKFAKGYSYKECLVPSDSEHLVDLKNRGLTDLTDDVIAYMDNLKEDINNIIDDYSRYHPEVEDNEESAKCLHDIIELIMRKAMRKELNGSFYHG